MAPIHLGFTPKCQLLGFNPTRVKETPPPACPFRAGRGGISLPVAPIPIARVYPLVPTALGFNSYADFSAEGVRVASVLFSVNPSLLCTYNIPSLSMK